MAAGVGLVGGLVGGKYNIPNRLFEPADHIIAIANVNLKTFGFGTAGAVIGNLYPCKK